MKVDLTKPSDDASSSSLPAPRSFPRRLLRSLVLWGFALCALLLALYVLRSPILAGLATAWIVNDPLAKADAIVILGGGLETRPFAAAKLYNEGYAPRILIARPKPSPTDELGLTTRESDIARQILLKQGVPESALIEMGDNVRNTYDESLALRDWASQRREDRREQIEVRNGASQTPNSELRTPGGASTRTGESRKEIGDSSPAVAVSQTSNSELRTSAPISDLRTSAPISDLRTPGGASQTSNSELRTSAPISDLRTSVIIVTDLFHTRRVRWIFRKQLKSTGVHVIVRAVPVREYTQADWWRHEQGLVAFQNEVLKFAYYWVKY